MAFRGYHSPIILFAIVLTIIVLANWHPWTESTILQEAQTAQTELQSTDDLYSSCLGPFNVNAPPSNATNSMCFTSYATAVHGILWPNPTTTHDANAVIDDADALAGLYNSGVAPPDANTQQWGNDRDALSTALSDTISAAGG
jgi:hypothetical protein